MFKKVISIILLISILSSFSLMFETSAADSTSGKIDNSDIMPKWVPDSEVTVDENGTPDWVDGLIMAELRILTATEEGTLKSATKVLDHYQEMGVNGLWISPVSDPGPKSRNPYKNTYSNLGIHTIDPNITGTTDYDKGRQELKKFIDEAHKRNIRIFLDVISWGTVLGAPLFEEHPEWYQGTQWGGDAFLWTNPEFVSWYKKEIIDLAVETGCDGFRYDCEPEFAGYLVHKDIRQRLLDKGRKLCMIGEHANERNGAYDLDQYSIYNTDTENPMPLINKFNIVDIIKNGELGSEASQDTGEGGMYKYYTFMASSHDFRAPGVKGNKLALGYQAIFAPFIPLWYIGDEWNNPHQSLNPTDMAMFFNKIDWEEFEKPENQKFFEEIKAMIRIRRQNPEIFADFSEHIIDANICKVNVKAGEDLQSYARYAGNTAIIVVPNFSIKEKTEKMTVYLPFKDMNLYSYRSYKVTDAYTGKEIVSGVASKVAKFDVTVPYQDMAVIKIEAEGKFEQLGKESNDLELSDDDNLDKNQSENDEETKTIIRKKFFKKNKSGETSYLWLILIIVGAVLLITGGTFVTIFIVKKKKKSKKQ